MLQEAETFLDEIYEEMSSAPSAAAMERLFAGLLRVRAELEPDAWRQFSTVTAVRHRLRDLIHEDPMARRSFEKPRGYPGDAVLLDYIYRLAVPETSSVGRCVYDYAATRPAASAVRHRRGVLAQTIDEVAAESRGPARVLSIASGHLREGHVSRALGRGDVEEIVALDADPHSVSVVAETFTNHPVSAREMSVRRILDGSHDPGSFDLAYSAGLYDYLPERTARRLTAWMFRALRPGGRLLFSNFVPQVIDAGYMETYMGWQLIYRDKEALEGLVRDLPNAEVAERKVWVDPHDAIGYVEVRRAR